MMFQRAEGGLVKLVEASWQTLIIWPIHANSLDEN
jgi:hypothetical protein